LKFLVLFIFLLPLAAQAQEKSVNAKSINLGFMKLRLLGGLKLGRTSMMSKNDFVEKRDMNTIGAHVIFGANIGPLILGLDSSYTQMYQATDKKDVSGTNTSGNLTQFAGALGVGSGKLCLIGKYIFKADYALSQKTSTDEKETFSKPEGSYAASLLYRPGGRSFWSIDYQIVNFTEVKIGSTKINASTKDKQINFTSFGITYGFMF
jgi:hypothetical protein